MQIGVRNAVVAGLLAMLGSVTVACGRGQIPIPSGAQQVHVVVTTSEVRLEPSTVRPGEVYLVLEAPPNGSITFVEAKRSAAASPEPLTGDDLDRLARGDTRGTSIAGLDAGGCSPEQDAADRGQMGPCGNVMLVVVSPGRYAVVGGNPEDGMTGTAPPMAVLVVEP
jgi:hypothetical protein